MDREQAIKIIKDCKEKSFKRTLYTLNEYYEALDMAIEALEQEPTDAVQRTSNANKKHVENTLEDAISRQAAIDAMATWDWQELYLPMHFKQLLEELPSVSTEKTGRWERHSYYKDAFICSVCNTGGNMVYKDFKYCPNCGAKMEEEREVKE